VHHARGSARHVRQGPTRVQGRLCAHVAHMWRTRAGAHHTTQHTTAAHAAPALWPAAEPRATCPPARRYDFVIVSYDLLKDVSEVLEGMEFQVVVLDESHCIKNATVRQQVAVEAAGSRSRGAMCSALPRATHCNVPTSTQSHRLLYTTHAQLRPFHPLSGAAHQVCQAAC
jgi:hypothetical protein